LDSLYQGYPVGYLIAWRNPAVKLKDGTPSAGKRILIDGQQRVTALMAALLGREVLTKDYETVRIRIAFHPQEERFEVANPAIRKDVAWIADVADLGSATGADGAEDQNLLQRALAGNSFTKKVIGRAFTARGDPLCSPAYHSNGIASRARFRSA
jgi:uncharacterized protein with ParB-like and HNH nuclease domain